MEKLSMTFVLVTHLIAATKCLREKRRVYVNHSLSTRHILVGGRQWWEIASGYYGKGMSLPADVREDDKKQSHTINLKVCSLVWCSFWKLQKLLKQQLAHKCSLCVPAGDIWHPTTTSSFGPNSQRDLPRYSASSRCLLSALNSLFPPNLLDEPLSSANHSCQLPASPWHLPCSFALLLWLVECIQFFLVTLWISRSLWWNVSWYISVTFCMSNILINSKNPSCFIQLLYLLLNYYGLKFKCHILFIFLYHVSDISLVNIFPLAQDPLLKSGI